MQARCQSPVGKLEGNFDSAVLQIDVHNPQLFSKRFHARHDGAFFARVEVGKVNIVQLALVRSCKGQRFVFQKLIPFLLRAVCRQSSVQYGIHCIPRILRQQCSVPSKVGHFVFPFLCGHLPAAGRFSRLDLSCGIDVLPKVDLAGVFHLPFQIEQLSEPLLRIELFIEPVVLCVHPVVFLRVSRLFGVEQSLQLPVDLLIADIVVLFFLCQAVQNVAVLPLQALLQPVAAFIVAPRPVFRACPALEALVFLDDVLNLVQQRLLPLAEQAVRENNRAVSFVKFSLHAGIQLFKPQRCVPKQWIGFIQFVMLQKILKLVFLLPYSVAVFFLQRFHLSFLCISQIFSAIKALCPFVCQLL